MTGRTTQDVFDDHLRLRRNYELEQDLQRNYAEDVVLICDFGVIRGHSAIRESARRLGLQLPHAQFRFTVKQIADEFAFLVWEATSDEDGVKNGVDSFVIRDGKIVMQTIHYTLAKDA